MATMQDVARHAGVSLSTVSYVINKTRPISDATRARVEAAMIELGYRRNAAARSLASKRSRTIALVLPSTENALGGTLSEIVTQAARAARARDNHVAVWPGLGTEEQDAAEIQDLVLGGAVDGVVFLEVSLDDARVATLEKVDVPFVTLGRPARTEGRACVDIDFDAAVDEAVALLAAEGHRQIGFVNHSEASQRRGYGPSVRAEAAFATATRAHGVVGTHVWADEDAAGGRGALDALLGAAPAPTAVVLMNETAGFGLLAQARRRGVDVPGDLSVLAIATSRGVGALAEPQLTSLEVPAERLARHAVETLLDLVEGGEAPTEPILVPCALAPGDSVAPPRDR
ncbi:LacI family transcriptional regulator [Flavimobilis soli]|uniref:LacI family transcriptional regulator n=1 Tax=Flavimobilis soli TaxID=442709 RepID=A0A2A9EF76_9MICO|nr:LacI family DNA-binding transcriptional regulator [Flavimobilis soli]PFG37697.1 LacI family transcriptional regulator [Flavimobilis soli]